METTFNVNTCKKYKQYVHKRKYILLAVFNQIKNVSGIIVCNVNNFTHFAIIVVRTLQYEFVHLQTQLNEFVLSRCVLPVCNTSNRWKNLGGSSEGQQLLTHLFNELRIIQELCFVSWPQQSQFQHRLGIFGGARIFCSSVFCSSVCCSL